METPPPPKKQDEQEKKQLERLESLSPTTYRDQRLDTCDSGQVHLHNHLYPYRWGPQNLI